MTTTTDYYVIDEYQSSTLMKKVQAMLAKGWEPLGGIAVFQDKSWNSRYLQAMVKYERSERR